MKKVVCMMMVLCCWASAALADEGEGLSLQAREYIELQTKEMSQLGMTDDQTAQARLMLQMMLQNRFENRNMVQAQQVVMTATKAGLPTEPIMSKAMEGMAKQVPPEQIIAAMETVAERQEYAANVAKSLVTEKKDVEAASRAVADSLAAGMQPEDIDSVQAQLRIANQIQTRTQLQTQTQTQTRTQTRTRTRINQAEDEALVVETLGAVRAMARLGVASSEVADIVSEALADDYTSSDMKALGEQMASQAGKESAAAIADSHAASIGKSDDAGQGSGSDNGSASGNSGSGSSGNSGGNSGGGSGSGSSGNSGGSGSSGNSGGGSGSGSSGNSGGSGSSGNSGGGNGAGGNR